MIEGPLTAKKVNDDPPSYRVWFDDGTGALEVGSISQQYRHTANNEVYWRWGVDTMPLLGGRSEPGGDCWSRDAALQAFRDAFFKWVNGLHPGDWQRNREHKKAAAARHLRR